MAPIWSSCPWVMRIPCILSYGCAGIEVGDDVVNSQHVAVREHAAAVHDDSRVLILVQHHVTPNFSQPAQRDDF